MHMSSHPLASTSIIKDFYVDDLLTGADTYEKLQLIRNDIIKILSSANLSLTKWYSNHESFTHEQTIEKSLQFNDSDETKALGIKWLPKPDVFKFALDNNFNNLRSTKRNILSISSRLFDPLGLLCPFIIQSKILLQELWLQKLDWDESIPLRIETTWNQFKTDLANLSLISIPRYVHTNSSSNQICEIHGFSDASIKAYGCCLYIVCRNQAGTKCTLLTAKSRVAPLKTKTLPRLELCAAHLLAKLWSQVSKLLSRKIKDVFLWTDSQITLHWIKMHSSVLNTFVANRVSEIQEWSQNAKWSYVPTKENPADLVSRGCTLQDLSNSEWFTGPKFLLGSVENWPQQPDTTVNEDLLEIKKNAIVALAAQPNASPLIDFIEKHSSHNKLLIAFSYLMRWFNKTKSKEFVFEKTPSSIEMNLSFLKIVQLLQEMEFSDEMSKLSKNSSLQPSVQKLNPFLHETNEGPFHFKLLRVGGRLLNAPISYDTKFPLLLKKDSNFVQSYLRCLHVRNHHAGPKALLALAREKIWIINAREVCRQIVRKCIHCFKYKPRLTQQIMGNLPADRLKALRPFLITGVDFFGPVYITVKIRGRPPVKMYIAVFVCFASKAVHFELVSNLSSDNFICAFKRFVGRRGIPQKLYCDNATNFVGAQRQLKEMKDAFLCSKSEILQYAAIEGFQFVFIPPRAPHFGGLWEAAVKSAKGLLIKTTGAVLLTVEELETLLIEIEAVLNSRPISALSQDPNDGEALTPGHLLIGCPLRSIPTHVPETQTTAKLPYLDKWHRVSFLKQQFWHAWSKHYLLDMQQRTKWQYPQRNVDVGDLVIISEDNLPPLQWLVGRVASVVIGDDGKVRVANVITKSGLCKRPIHKLAVLPVND